MNTFLAITWDFDPVFFEVFGLEVRYYGLFWAFTFLSGLWYFSKFAKREGLPDKVVDSVFFYVVIFTIIGARLGHCFFYEPAAYLADPITIFYLRDGGMASHGAALGILTGLWLFARKNKLPYIWGLDRVMLPVTVGGAGVRIGNFLNSEIYGAPTDLPWGVVFKRAGETVPCHPTQLYEALFYLMVFAVLVWLYFRKDAGRKYPGMMAGVGIIGIFIPRFFIEFIKNTQVDFEVGMMLNMGQWLSIPFIIMGIVMIFVGLKNKK